MARSTEPWVSVEYIAAHVGVRKDSIYRWIENRGLPAQKIGKLWKLKLSEVDAWVRDTLHDFLSDEGYGALLASDGAEALRLPGSTSPQASIPVIVVTADRSANVTGAAVLRKPLHLISSRS